jgi:hypothetical protein
LKIISWLSSFPADLAEALKCIGLAIRDGSRPRLAFTSVALGAIATLFLSIIFLVWWTEIWAASLVVSTLLTAGLLVALLPVAPVAAPSIVAMGGIAAGVVPYILSLPLGAVLAGFVMLASFVLLVMISMRVAVGVLLMGRIQRYCLAHYPEVTTGAESTLKANVRDSLGTLTGC